MTGTSGVQTDDQLIDEQLERLAKKLVEAASTGNVTTVIHKTQGMGNWGAAAVVACFATWFALILFGVWVYFQVSNLWAWKDIHNAKISVLEGKQR